MQKLGAISELSLHGLRRCLFEKHEVGAGLWPVPNHEGGWDMRVLKLAAQTTALGFAFSLAAGSALAGGWSSEGIADYGLMFEDGKFLIEGQTTYGVRSVDFKDAKTKVPNPLFNGSQPVSPSNPTHVPAPGESKASDIAPNISFNSVAAKVQLIENLDLYARFNQPYVIREQPGYNWSGRFAIAETNADSLGVDAMLSYKHEVSEGNFLRVFGGVRSVTVDYEQMSRTVIGGGTPSAFETDVKIGVDTEREYGYRLGASYEIPEIALRAMIAYESEIDLELSGDFGITLPALAGGSIAALASADATLPQSVEAKIQTGIAPKWLATFGVKWTDWSVLNELSVDLESSDPRAPSSVVRDLGYKDGWIVEAGVGHQLTDKLSLGSSLTWDKGIGGPYSDYYALSLGGAYDFAENVKLTLGGRAIYKTAGEGVYDITRNSALGAQSVSAAYEYDSSWNFAVSSKLRVGF